MATSINWGAVLLAIPMVCYAGQGVWYWMNGLHGMAITFAAYSLANVGLIIDARRLM